MGFAASRTFHSHIGPFTSNVPMFFQRGLLIAAIEQKVCLNWAWLRVAGLVGPDGPEVNGFEGAERGGHVGFIDGVYPVPDLALTPQPTLMTVANFLARVMATY